MAIRVVCLMAAVTAGGGVWAQKPKKASPQKPPAKAGAPVVLGTTQLPGEFGKIGTTYTIGKSTPLNFTLRSAEYSATRVLNETYSSGITAFAPQANEKMLLLHFTVQNPQPRDVRLFGESFKITAVDIDDVNHEVATEIVREGRNNKFVDFPLKPAQKIELYAGILVPADGEVPKLIVQRQLADGAVVRYDLRGKVKGIPPPFADPKDPKGATRLASIPAQRDTYYPISNYDVKVGQITFADTVAGIKATNGNRFAVVTLMFRGYGTRNNLSESSFRARMTTTDGDTVDARSPGGTGGLLRASRDEAFNGPIEAGTELPLRVFFEIPTGVGPKTVTLGEATAAFKGTNYVFDVSNTP